MTDTLHAIVPDLERRPRAVLCADVVGYTRLMEAAESETHAHLRTLRVTVIDPAIVSHRGEVVKNTGDGFIAVFVSPRDALHCAAALQRELVAQESGAVPERRILFRIGLHWEQIIFDENDVFGSGINIAVRLQSAAPAGGVVVSSALLDQVPDRAEFAFDDLGKLSLKNLTQPVRGFALSVPGSARADLRRPADEPKAARLPAIAVLPFAHLSSDVQDGYFAEGFADDIIVTLGNIPELVVVSRGSTIPFRRRPVDPGEVSEKLGVRYVLSGSVRRTQNRIRISVELVDAVDASVVWAERYDEPIDEVFNLQDEIAIRIVGKIATYVRRAELQRALRKPPQSLNAYDWLLRGLDLLYRLDFGSLAQARTCLERARDEDRDYSAPYAFLAHWHMFAIAEGWASGTEAGLGEVVRLAQCAVERDPCNALAVAIEGHARAMFFRDYDAGIELCDRATAISPNNSWAWVFSSGPYGFVGDPRMGIARAERAIRLAPLGQQAFFNYTLLAQNQYLAGSFGDAVRWSRKALHLNPRFGNAARVLAALPNRGLRWSALRVQRTASPNDPARYW
ncbi:adenylate/guanylate cyclase domain-containing protein, partial [Methylobacterium platani]|uniref:adenylate/guanylate cyclase domain-containing protein n=1 Tax=Methylobacterium platani TaxID=427683 RepID=UPI00069E9FF9